MGPTGSGKSNVRPLRAEEVAPDLLSQFIVRLLAGRPKPQSLKSETSGIKAYRIFNPAIDSRTISSIVVVDTPGFDDTTRTDYDILSMAADWLHSSYARSYLAAAILPYS